MGSMHADVLLCPTQALALGLPVIAAVAPVDVRLSYTALRSLHAGVGAARGCGIPLPAPVSIDGEPSSGYHAALKAELSVRGRAVAGLFM